MENRVNALVNELEQSGYLLRKKMGHSEYIENLEGFQEMVCRMVLKDEYSEGMRMEDALFKIKKMAGEKDMYSDPDVKKGIQALKDISAELGICIAGRNGERRAAKGLNYIERPDATNYLNVYLNDEIDETELDMVSITENGIVFFEVKNACHDITVNERGLLLFDNETCHDTESIVSKMDRKARILKKVLSEKLAEKNVHVPIIVDSYVCFSTKKDVRITVTNNCRGFKYCFNGRVNRIIDCFESNYKYDELDLRYINEAMAELAAVNREFELKRDFDLIRRDFATAWIKLTDEEAVNENPKVVEIASAKKPAKASNKLDKYDIGMAGIASVAGVFAGPLLLGLMAMKKRA